METTSPSFRLDDDGFDWEAAVREIDSTCQSTIPLTFNAGEITAIPSPPTTPSASVANAVGAWPRPSAHPSRARQSTLDRFMDTFAKQESSFDHRSKSCLQEPVAEACEDRYDPCGAGNEAPEVSIDFEAAKTWIYPVNVPIRDYQLAIVQTALFSNTLVALPTGLGKTFIAAVVMYNYFRWFPKGKIVFAAPSRPLVMQQIEACHNITGIPQEWTIDMTGQMSPPIRLRFWETKRVFFVTPQVLENDIQTGICLVKQLVCLVIDEAHRATGNSSYCVLVRELMDVSLQLRILALTATPGSKHQKIQNVIDSLCISTLEYRHESDHDVSPYVHNRKLELMVVPMGKDAVEINSLLLQAIQPFVARLSTIGVLLQRDLSMLSPYEVLRLRDKFRQAPPTSVPRSKFGDVEVCFNTLVTFYHIRKLLSSHGIRPAYEMLQERMNQGLFLKQVSKIEVFWKAKHLMQLSLSHGAPTPKLAKMLEILVDHFKTKDPKNSRVIIFSSFRGSVRDIMNSLSCIGDMVKATEFIGQSSGKTLKGQTQKMQQAVLEKFRSGGYNVIIATSIGEEGLDIMEVDLVICFDANVSPLRMIQRMGRTGRKNDGRVVVLACQGCEVMAYSKKQASSKAMRKHMLNGGIKSFSFHPSSRMVPHMCKPQVQYVKMSIEQFIPRGKKVRNEIVEILPFSRNISNEEQSLIAKYFHQSKDVILRPSLIAFPTFQAFPSQISRVRHSFKTTSMLIDAMQVLQGLSFCKLKNDGLIKDESSQPYNQLSASRDNSGQGSAVHCSTSDSGIPFQVSALECKFGFHMHHGVQKPSPHSFLFGEDYVTLNSFGSVVVANFPVLQHIGPQCSIVISTENCALSPKGPKFKYKHSASLPVASSKPTMQVEDPKLKASTELKQSGNGSPSSLFIKEIQNEQANEKNVFQTPGCMLKPKEPEESATEVNGKMEDILLASSVARSRDAVDDIFLSPRLTHFIEEGIVPESPLLNNNHHVTNDEKRPFSRFSCEDEKDNKCSTRMHVNKLLSDGLESQSMAVLDTLCKSKSLMHFSAPPNSILISEMSSKEFSKNEKEVTRVQNTMNNVKSEKNIAYAIHDAIHTPFADTLNQISSEEWKCNSGEASDSIFQAPKYKRLRKHGDVVRKLHAKALEARFEMTEKAFGSTMSIQENKPKCSNGEKQKAKVHVYAFIEEEAEVSDDASVSEDERFDEKDDQYYGSFIDDRINPTEGSTETENSGSDMIAFYRRSLLTQSPVVFTEKYMAASHESLSSGTAGSCSQEKWHNPVETPQDGLQSVNQLDARNSVIGPAGLGTAAVSGEATNHSERCSSRLESRKRKLIFQPADAIPEENSQLQHELQSVHAESVSLHHQMKLPTKLPTDSYLSCDDDFYQDLDLDEVEAQATKLLRCGLESSLEKSETAAHDCSAQIDEHTSSGFNFICSPSFDLGI